jgi:hypothetical protein
VVLAVLLLARRSGPDPDADLDALTRMLLTETDFAHPQEEMAQLVFVALNRMRRHNSNAFDVVTSPTWCHTSKCRARFGNMDRNPRWADARLFVQKVIAGSYVNRGYIAFVHPRDMGSTTPCSRPELVWTQTFAGMRCIPSWAVGGDVIGQGMFARA